MSSDIISKLSVPLSLYTEKLNEITRLAAEVAALTQALRDNQAEVIAGQRENERLRAANRDLQLHFDVLNDDFKRLRTALDKIANGPRDADLSYLELFVEVKLEARAALNWEPSHE